MKSTRKWLLALAALALLAPMGLAAAKVPAPVVAADASLAAIHNAKGVECAACHGKAAKIVVDDSENGVSAACTKCHGKSADLAAKSKHHINPHSSHLGEVNCSACHKGHQQSAAYCNGCHTFDLPMAGAKAAAPAKTPAKPAGTRREATDVVIIGSGAAGMSAAITAHDAGARVIIIEKQPISGGNSNLAAGGMNAAGTRFQQAKGIKDSVDLMYEDTMKGGGNINVAALAWVLARNSASSVEWLTSIGADISDVGLLGGASVSRAHRPTGGQTVGPHVVAVLRKNVAQRRIDLRLNSKVVKILEDKSGRVTGVVVEGRHRGTYTIVAKAVVLAAGGFSANPDKVGRYQPQYRHMTTSNQPGATGDGMDLGEAAGAELKDMKEIQIHPTVAAGSRILITEGVRGNGAIMVNREGKRFINEVTTRDKASAATLAQTGGSAYLVFDEGVRRSLKQIEGYFHLDLVKEGATIADLATTLKMPPAALEATIAAYNAAVGAKKDAEFGRPDLPRALSTPKYYAIEVKPGIHYTMGGVRINASTQVIARNGAVMPGFFAAGEVTGGVHGNNRLGGNSVSETITFGRIAGASAAAEAKGGR